MGWWKVRYRHVSFTSHDCDWGELPTDGVLYVETPDDGRVSGHDHYWLEGGRVRTADHHDYDRGEPDWRTAPLIKTYLPRDKHTLNGTMIPDEEWEVIINE